MTKDPTSFDDKMPVLTTTLASSIQTEDRLITMVDEIFQQALEDAQFRYTGARLCNYFSYHLSVQGTTQTFRQHLLRRCHEEHNKRDALVQSCDNRYKLVSFMLFMGELLLNTNEFAKTPESMDYTKMLSKAVRELLLTLLSQPADDTLRCVVQVLKLCGSVAEDTERSVFPGQAPPEMDKIYTVIKSEILQSSYVKGIRAQMVSVIELRASDWGRQEPIRGAASSSSLQPLSNAPPPRAPPPAPTQVPSYSNAPVNPAAHAYYDPGQQQQGMPAGFDPSAGMYPEDMSMYSSGDEDFNLEQAEMYYKMYNDIECIQEDDMPPEIAAAFEEFQRNLPRQWALLYQTYVVCSCHSQGQNYIRDAQAFQLSIICCNNS